MTGIAYDLPAAAPERAAPRASSLLETVLFLIVLLGVAAPILFLVLGSFSPARLPSEFSFSTLTLRNYLKVWSDPGTYEILSNTLLFAVGSTLFGLLFATIMAWLAERTDVPGRIWIYAGLPMTLAMPGMLQAMAWTLILSPRAGFINKGLMAALGLQSAPFNVYSLSGMIFVEGLRTVPTAFLMLVPLLRSMDPSLEEAAAMCGARQVAVLRKVTLGLMLPGIVAVMISHPQRDRLRAFLAQRGIATGIHYPVPIHLQPAYAELGYRTGSFPVAERWATQCLSLPMFAELSADQIERIVTAVHEFDGVEQEASKQDVRKRVVH